MDDDRRSGARLGLIVHHTDAEREYAYDRKSHVGKLDKALDAAAVNRWTVVDMKNDSRSPHRPLWRAITFFPGRRLPARQPRN